MPMRKRNASSELGSSDLNFTVDRNARTGRPIRKRRKTQQQDSPFVDSAVAVSDPEDDDVDNLDDNFSDSSLSEEDMCPAWKARKVRPKRRRSPSPPLSDDQDRLHEDLMMSCDDTPDVSSILPPPSSGDPANAIVIKDLTINLPAGHVGPITLQLTPPCSSTPSTTTTVPAEQLPPGLSFFSPSSLHRRSRRGRRPSKSPSTLSNSQQQNKPQHPQSSARPHSPHAGFLDLPAELRIEIYRQVLVSSRELSFDWPDNFRRCAALLRTCKQIHSEAREILYGENRFVFLRRSTRCGSYWETEWTDVGFKVVRRFLKSIGVENTALLRSVALVLTDATPSLSLLRTTIDERRFVNDDVLLSVLRHLADFGRLQRLELHFHGRRRVEKADERFLDYLLDIRADDVVFTNGRNIVGSAASSPSKQDFFVERLCLELMPRRTRLYEDNKISRTAKNNNAASTSATSKS